jgi:conjugative relaxase-like TrwC/TraI family protein
MVASISARGGVQAALGYYAHLGQDDYYLRDGEPPGGWAGEGAARLSLAGPVTKSEFEAALRGIDPKTGERLAALGGRVQDHAAGWDMTFSAPKSVSVLWALSEARERPVIEGAHQTAVAAATRYLEQTAAWARRGKGGATREPTAGLLMATFEHHTSRELDPQLHAHVFIFNLAPRRDGTWGAIVSRELYKAQKRAGAVYRSALAGELERAGYAVERASDNFRTMSSAPSPSGARRSRQQLRSTAIDRRGAWSWRRCAHGAASATWTGPLCSSCGARKRALLASNWAAMQPSRKLTRRRVRSQVAGSIDRLLREFQQRVLAGMTPGSRMLPAR